MIKIKLGYTLISLFCVATAFSQTPTPKQTKSATFPCMVNPQAREFDFWLGEWEVYKRGTTQLVGYSKIQNVSDGCAILESWTAAGGTGSGKSLNFIDPATHKWKQTWVGSRGAQEFVDGEYKDGAMLFTFESIDPKGHQLTGRFIFYNESPNRVRQLNEVSADNGKTWIAGYDFTYIRKKAVN